MNKQTIFITGGAGFIGSALVRWLLDNTAVNIINIDKLTYAGNLHSLPGVENNPDYFFSKTDITDRAAMAALFDVHQPDAILHLAAESHVDRSIESGLEFVQTNIVGTAVLLEVALGYWNKLDIKRQQEFRFQHISTDEVYGSLGDDGLFTETTAYDPSSPYSASKASSDHLVRAWHRTYGLPVLLTNCSNNYGPYQFPEKLIPHIILRALEGKSLPVYGNGENVRDWLYVDDHVRALWAVLQKGVPGETYNIGGNCEKQNIDVVREVCTLMDERFPDAVCKPHDSLITYVTDRPGHDQRYAIDSSKIQRELGWQPEEDFTSGLRKTVDWYLDQHDWWKRILDGSYQTERLGVNHEGEGNS